MGVNFARKLRLHQLLSTDSNGQRRVPVLTHLRSTSGLDRRRLMVVIRRRRRRAAGSQGYDGRRGEAEAGAAAYLD